MFALQVWDLRTFRLRRTVPCLYNTQLAFSPAGTVAYATQRSLAEDGLKMLKRDPNLLSPPFSGFCTVDFLLKHLFFLEEGFCTVA